MVESSTVEDAGIGLGQRVFCSRALDHMATIQGWPLFKGGHYSRVATIRGWPLFEGGHYLRAASIWRKMVDSCTRSNELFLLLFFAPKYREFVV